MSNNFRMIIKPKITIITVNYNNLNGLKKTIESVKNQTYQEFEYLVIDGGSTDGSSEYLDGIKDDLNYYVSEPDSGVYQAMNKGIKKAKGEYLLFLNSGDHFYDSKVLDKNLKDIKEADIIYFDLQVVEGTEKFIKTYPDTLSFSYFVEDTLPHPATFIKRDAFSRTNFFKEDFKILSDWKFFIDAICKYNLTYKKINEILSTFFIGGMSSIPENRSLKYSERQLVLENDYKVFMQDIDDVLVNKKIVENFRKSRIVSILVKFGFLHKY